MDDYKINFSYGKALFQTALENPTPEKGTIHEVYHDMTLVRKVCKDNHMLNTVFANPVIRADKKYAILLEIFGNEVCELTKLFFRFVVKKNRTVNLKGISLAYMNFYREHEGILHSDIMTAVEVDPELIEQGRQIIAAYSGKKVEVESHVTNRMLGCFRLSFDDKLYDARIRTKIAKLRLEFSKNIYESKL